MKTNVKSFIIFSLKQAILCLFLITVLFVCHQKPQQQIPYKKPKDRTEKFLRYVMITNFGAYTLMGVKPITEFRILAEQPSDEHLHKLYNSLSEKTKQAHSFEELAPHFEEEYSLWHNWSEQKGELLGKNFRFFASPAWNNTGIFANLTAVALLLDQHYEDFKTTYGQDFEPTQIALEIDQADSPFWEVTFSNHYLCGLLFGYGRENARLFSWELEKKRPGDAKSFSPSRILRNDEPEIIELPLPAFMVYSPLDETVMKYQKFCQAIIDYYSGKDFKEECLRLLKDDSSSLKAKISY